MRPPAETDALERIEFLLGQWLPAKDLRLQRVASPRDEGADLLVRSNGIRFAVEYKGSSTSASIAQAILQLRRWTQSQSGRVAIVAVPFMGESGRNACREAGISWMDLSGNADIEAPGLLIRIQGQANQFVRRGRPSSALAPRSSRIARAFLMEPSRTFLQRDLAEMTGLDDGFVSRIVRRLVDDGLLVRDGATLRARDPSLLLESWREAYDFDKHRLVRCHATSDSGEELARQIATRLERDGVRHAATGLAGAWLLTRFASFRLATFFLQDAPTAEDLSRWGVRTVPRGGNLLLATPNDMSVFQGATVVGGISCVHPLQAYLDLKSHPERSAEAAEELRRRLLARSAPA